MRTWVTAAFLCLSAGSTAAASMVTPSSPAGHLCRQAIDAAERAHGVPAKLLAAIGRVESGRRDPLSGKWNPWPWTVNADGQGCFFDNRAQALAAVRAMQARGIRSIDVGCMQVNLQQHPEAFTTLEQAFDPAANANYAARFLNELFLQSGSWSKAAGLYHSATPGIGSDYQRKVMAVWPEEQRSPGGGTGLHGATSLAASWPANLPHTMFAPYRQQPAARIISLPLNQSGQSPTGRTLASYRAAPVMLAYRAPRPSGG